MLNFIDKWYDKIKPFLFKYKDGFFELPYLGSSPIINNTIILIFL